MHHYKNLCYLFAPCLVHLFGRGWVDKNKFSWSRRILQGFLRSKHYILAACLMYVVFWTLTFRKALSFLLFLLHMSSLTSSSCFSITFSQGERNYFGFAKNCQMAIVSRHIILRLKSIAKDSTSEVEGHEGWDKSHWCKTLVFIQRIVTIVDDYHLYKYFTTIHAISTNIIVTNSMRSYYWILQMKY